MLGCGVNVKDQILNDQNVTATMIKVGNCRIGVVMVYFEGDISIGLFLTLQKLSGRSSAMHVALNELALTVKMVKSVMIKSVEETRVSCNQLNDVVETYNKCIRQACEPAIPLKDSERKLKLPWWNSELGGLNHNSRNKKRCMWNAVPN
ncbi:hypothetical protein EVAR_26070_1 [Eumeta japonica]|uniref:Uncharacterized protein n=1 Tax=Eumeta variegata TaxID=151549 RepID=A0A4C1VS20_EUMVA|nr:hypothetical protein EVAR_26070_1 [Eumeta japonica]